ncbi:NAD(P)H-quinone oxidoreductase subunit 1, chloroplastic [Streptomyces antimycoticus]
MVVGAVAGRRRGGVLHRRLAELQRPPFDAPVADSEIIFGAYTEYTGLRFALFLLAEYAGIVILCRG